VLSSCCSGTVWVNLKQFPVAPVTTGTILSLIFHTHWISIVSYLYFKTSSASFLITFLSPKIATSTNMDVSGFGGLEVAWWPLEPSSSRIQTRPKKESSARISFGREVKPWVPCRRFTACKRSLKCYVEVGHISCPTQFHLWLLGSLSKTTSGESWEHLKLQGYNFSFLCLGGVAARNWWRKLESPIRGIV
jgi:hypothetical protein